MSRSPASKGFPRRENWLWVLGSLTLFAACNRVTPDNIALWKTTEKGPHKLADAVTDRGLDPELRAQAAAALVDIGKAEDVEAELAAMPAAERWEVLARLVPIFVARLSDPAPEKALGFRDALFSARAWARPEDQALIDAALLPGIERELRTGRVLNGRHSVQKILTAIGRPAGATLARLLGEPIPGYLAVAQLLSQVGDEAERERGAASLLARAEHERPIPAELWKAIGLLGGPAARKFLEGKVAAGADHDEALAAVRALQERRDPSVLAFALATAGDAKADRAIRDEMFGVIETVGGLEARDGLIHIIQTDRDEIVRYRAFESLLVVAKSEALVRGLEAFPAAAVYKRADVEDLLVKLIEKLGPPARPALVAALASSSPLARMTAVLSLEGLGRGADAAALETLRADEAVIKGFPVGQSIGHEVARVAGVARSKP